MARFSFVIVAALLALATAVEVEVTSNSTASLNNCGGNCPGNKCTTCPCGTSRNMVNINNICAQSNWNQNCCRCVIQHESSGNANAMNGNSNGSLDVGVFQINSINWPACNSGRPPCDVNQNFHCALQVYQRAGNSWRPWSTARACGC